MASDTDKRGQHKASRARVCTSARPRSSQHATSTARRTPSCTARAMRADEAVHRRQTPASSRARACNCKRCSFSQSVLPRAASLESFCEQHAKHGHANGCVAVDVHERVCRRVHRTAMTAADCDCIILTTVASRPEDLEPVLVVAGEKLSQLEEVRDLQHALFAAAVRRRQSAQEILRRAKWRRHGHLFPRNLTGALWGVAQCVPAWYAEP